MLRGEKFEVTELTLLVASPGKFKRLFRIRQNVALVLLDLFPGDVVCRETRQLIHPEVTTRHVQPLVVQLPIPALSFHDVTLVAIEDHQGHAHQEAQRSVA